MYGLGEPKPSEEKTEVAQGHEEQQQKPPANPSLTSPEKTVSIEDARSRGYPISMAEVISFQSSEPGKAQRPPADSSLTPPEKTKEAKTTEEAEQKAWYQTLNSTQGIVIFSATLAAVGATIYFMNSESAREQLSNSTLSMYAGQLLGAFGTVGSMLWNFGAGLTSGIWLMFTSDYPYRDIAETEFSQTTSGSIGLSVGSFAAYMSISVVIPLMAVAGVTKVVTEVTTKLGAMNRKRRDLLRADLRIKRIASEEEWIRSQISNLRQNARALVNKLVPISKMLQHTLEAQQLMRELENIRTASWKLDSFYSTISAQEKLLEKMQDIQKINILLSAFKPWFSLRSPSFDNNWTTVLKNLIKVYTSKEKELKDKWETTSKITWQTLPKEDWEKKYSAYHDLHILWIQLGVVLEIINSNIDTVVNITERAGLTTEYETIRKRYDSGLKKIFEPIEAMREKIIKAAKALDEQEEEKLALEATRLKAAERPLLFPQN